MSTFEIKAIPTRYAGCYFRSRLEARWAVFFTSAGIRWEYEPQGYQTSAGPYLPDFLLIDCGTWVEVKGNEQSLPRRLLRRAAVELPAMPCSRERGPKLLILGPLPDPPPSQADLGWLALNGEVGDDMQAGFGNYQKNLRPWFHDNPAATGHQGDWLAPTIDHHEPGIPDAYVAARSARFEHGQNGPIA